MKQTTLAKEKEIEILRSKLAAAIKDSGGKGVPKCWNDFCKDNNMEMFNIKYDRKNGSLVFIKTREEMMGEFKAKNLGQVELHYNAIYDSLESQVDLMFSKLKACNEAVKKLETDNTMVLLSSLMATIGICLVVVSLGLALSLMFVAGSLPLLTTVAITGVAVLGVGEGAMVASTGISDARDTNLDKDSNLRYVLAELDKTKDFLLLTDAFSRNFERKKEAGVSK